MKATILLAGLVGLGLAIAAVIAPAENPLPAKPADDLLATALESPEAFMFTEQLTSKLDSHLDLVITSARGLENRPEHIFVRTGTMRIFRADAGLDDFTKEGGLYWRCGATKGKMQFKQPGGLVMVVRDRDGTVHWYALEIDLRC